MKSFDQYINENRAYGKIGKSNGMDFNFFILLENVTEEKQYEAFDEFNKYANLDQHTIKNLLINKSDIEYYKDSDIKWIWYIKVYESWSDSENLRDTIDLVKMRSFDIRSHDNVIIPLDEFLKIGLKGAEELFKIKKDANKFNI